MARSKIPIISAIAFLLIAGIVPVVALFFEHGERALDFIVFGPHIFFFFSCLVAPIAVYVFVPPLIQLWHLCTPAGKSGLLSLALVAAGAACAFDYAIGLPQLFEFERRAQDATEHTINGHTLWEFYKSPEELGKNKPQLKKEYTEAMHELANRGMRSLAVVIPYYIAMYVQLVFAILYVLALGLVIWHDTLRTEDVVKSLFTTGILCLPWLPAQQAFIENKRLLYEGVDATSVILPMGIAILLGSMVLFGQLEKEQRKFALPQITFGALIVLLTLIPEITNSAWQLFSRDSHPAWSVMLYMFVLLFVAPRLHWIRVPPSTIRQCDQANTDKPLPKSSLSSSRSTSSVSVKKRGQAGRRR